jgi:hypothetical protein
MMPVFSLEILRKSIKQRPHLWTGILMSVLFLGILTALPLRRAALIGPDEGFELLKGFMVSHGFHLYTSVWNDQPPVHTLLLAGVFQLFGPSAFAARLLTVAFALLLLFSLVFLIRRYESPLTALLCVLLLFCAPWFLVLATSAMLELPALAVGYLSAVMLISSQVMPSSRRIFASGIIFGIALMIKLTIALLLPGILISLIAASGSVLVRKDFLKGLKCCSIWALGVFIAVGLIFILCPGLSISTLLSDHFNAHLQKVIAENHPDLYFNPLQLLRQHPEAMAALPSALILAYLTDRLKTILFPLINLLVAVIVFWMHSPYWGYYYLHLAIPFAWLCAVGIMLPFRQAFGTQITKSHVSLTHLGWLCLGSVLLSYAAVQSGSREWKIIYNIRNVERVEDSRLIAEVRRNRSENAFIYSVRPEYAFYSGMPSIPELAIMPLKRYASGFLDDQVTRDMLNRYKPALLILDDKPQQPEKWKNLLGAYEEKAEGDGFALYIRKLP